VRTARARATRNLLLFAWLRKQVAQIRRLGAVCVGAFLLAEAGILDGRRVTAHWKFGQELARRHPKVRVLSEPLWVKDGNIYTSAGISAGIDLALAWVEEDRGASLAQEAARELVLFLRRPGGQPQLSVSLASQASEMRAVQELQVWIAENIQRPLSVQILAERLSMSLRNFERTFTREVGTTPAQCDAPSSGCWASHRVVIVSRYQADRWGGMAAVAPTMPARCGPWGVSFTANPGRPAFACRG
jgi:transcriptional regulator GlxA family with amidase domain